MSVTLVGSSAVGLGDVASPWNPAAAPAHSSGNRLLLVVSGHGSASSDGMNVANGFTYLGGGAGGTGSQATDTGPMQYNVYGIDATSSSTTPPEMLAGPNPPLYQWLVFATSTSWRDTIGAGAGWITSVEDTSTASPLTGTAPAWTAFEPITGDAVFAVGAIPTDSGAAPTRSVTCTGLSGGSYTDTYGETGVGIDGALATSVWTGFTGTASAGLAVSLTFGATAGSQDSGIIGAIAVRETGATPASSSPPPPAIRRLVPILAR